MVALIGQNKSVTSDFLNLNTLSEHFNNQKKNTCQSHHLYLLLNCDYTESQKGCVLKFRITISVVK